MAVIELSSEFGYVVLLAIAFWLQQSIIFVIPVAIQRKRTGIQPPVLYPTDKLISSLKLSETQVNSYMCAQRVHQNNMEFLVIFFPIFLLAGLFDPINASIAGLLVWIGRLVTAIGYWISAENRIYGGWFHLPEFYIVYLAVRFGLSLVYSNA